MRKYVLFGLLVVYLLGVGFDWLKKYLPVALMASQAAGAPRQMENLGRGVVAVRASATEVLVSWRLLGYEPQDLPFNVYRSTAGGPAQKLNAEPLTSGTNFIDATADPSAPNSYFVRPVINGIELAASIPYTLPANAPARPYLTFPLQPAPDTYVHLIWVGDLDGDGEYDFIVSRLPLNSGRQFIGAYKRDGAFAVNGAGSLILGAPGATRPSVYYFQRLTLNSGAQVKIAGPALVVVANGSSLSGSTMGSPDRPEWLTLHIVGGDLPINSSSEIYGYVVIPVG